MTFHNGAARIGCLTLIITAVGAASAGAAALSLDRVSASARPASLPVAVDSPGTSRGALDSAVRPRYILFTPTAGGPVVEGAGNAGIHWSSWSARSGTGTTNISMVATNQALNSAYRRCYKATITLSDVEQIHGREVFERMTLSHVQTLRAGAPGLSDHFHLAAHGYWGAGYGWTGPHGPGYGHI
jgi:hypothetical protein